MSSLCEPRLASSLDDDESQEPISNKRQKTEEPTESAGPSSPAATSNTTTTNAAAVAASSSTATTTEDQPTATTTTAPAAPTAPIEYRSDEEDFIRSIPYRVDENDPTSKKLTITLVSDIDNTRIEVEKYLACRCRVVLSVVEDKPPEEDGLEVTCMAVSGPVLHKVIEYIRHFWGYKFTEDGAIVIGKEPNAYTPLLGPLIKPFDTLITDFEKEFLKGPSTPPTGKFFEDQKHLHDLLMAANYLDLVRLRRLAAAAIASVVKGKTLKELAPQFEVDPNISEEEQERIRKENPWVEA